MVQGVDLRVISTKGRGESLRAVSGTWHKGNMEFPVCYLREWVDAWANDTHDDPNTVTCHRTHSTIDCNPHIG